MTTQSRVWRRDMSPPQNEQKHRWLLSGSGRVSAAGGVFRSLAILALFNSLLLLLLLPPPMFGSSFVLPSSTHLLSAGRSRGWDHRGARIKAANLRVPLNGPRRPSGVCYRDLEARRALLVACSAKNKQDEETEVGDTSHVHCLSVKVTTATVARGACHGCVVWGVKAPWWPRGGVWYEVSLLRALHACFVCSLL